jgi:hypothetical protein
MFTAHLITVHSETDETVHVFGYLDGLKALAEGAKMATGDSVAVTHWIGRFYDELTLGEAVRAVSMRLNADGKMPEFIQRATVQPTDVQQRLKYLRSQIEAETISYSEIAELQSLVEFIEPGDVQLLEWAGVEEN